ncbi:MAG: hypothetical protein ACM3TR_04330 [Caulobacteraceae bacterium]
MGYFNINSIWSAMLVLIFFLLYDNFFKKTAMRNIGRPISLVLFLVFISLPDFFKVKNDYLYRLIQSISIIFALNLFNHEKKVGDSNMNNKSKRIVSMLIILALAFSSANMQVFANSFDNNINPKESKNAGKEITINIGKDKNVHIREITTNQ